MLLEEPKSGTKSKIHKKSSILGWPVGSKIEPKSIRNQMKHWLDFCNDFEGTFSRWWVDFGSKNLSKMRGLKATFFNLVANMREVWFWTTLPSFCYIFRLSEGRFSTLKVVFFTCFSECDFKTYFFRCLIEFLSRPNGSQNWWKNIWKSRLNFW